MTLCEHCKNTHDKAYGSGRFCSSKCAKAFSTAARRSEINQKVSNALSGRKLSQGAIRKAADARRKHPAVKYCPYCGDIATHSTCCDDCHRWRGNVTIFEKLKIDTQQKLTLCNEQAFDMLYELYFVKKWSKVMIEAEYQIRSNTLFYYFKKNGTSLRTLSDACSIGCLHGRISPGSSKQYHSTWHSTWDGKQVYLRSSYEVDFAKKLDKSSTPYEVEFRRIPYRHPSGEMKVAIPDFFLPLSNMIVEIKSEYTLDVEAMKARADKYRRLGYNFQLIVDGNNKEL